MTSFRAPQARENGRSLLSVGFSATPVCWATLNEVSSYLAVTALTRVPGHSNSMAPQWTAAGVLRLRESLRGDRDNRFEGGGSGGDAGMATRHV